MLFVRSLTKINDLQIFLSNTDIPISTQSDLKSTQNKCHKCQYDIVIRLKKVTAASKTSQILK